MAGKTFKLAIIVDAITKGAIKGLGGVNSTLGGLAKTSLAAGAIAGTAMVGIGAGAIKLAVDAAPLQGIQDAFKGITTASGESSAAVLASMKKSSAGMVTQRDLMKKYNLAASLVSDTFANELPDAMGYLTKVAAGTGEDMGYMLDSLVRGVGRLSPMILDNLGIQVDLTAANKAYAASMGMAVGDMTKQEKQAALMAQVMEKLAANTEAMPEVMGTAAQKTAAFVVKLKDFKDMAGIALLPALGSLMDSLMKLGEVVFPILADAIERIAPLIAQGAEAFGILLDKFLSGEITIGSIKEKLLGLIPPSVLATILTLKEIFVGAFNSIKSIILEDVWPSLKSAFNDLTEAMAILGIDWSDVWEAIKGAVVIVAGVIGAVIGVVIAVILGVIRAIAKVAEYVASVLPDIASTFKLAWESIANLVGGAMAIIKGICTRDLDLIKAGWQAWVTGLIGIVRAFGQGIVNSIKLTFGIIITAVVEFIAGFLKFFENLYKELVGGSLIPDMMADMLAEIVAGFASIIASVISFIADMINQFVGLGAELYEIGANIMESLKEGIISRVAAIIQAVKDAVNAVVDAAKDVVGMGSPSLVFVQMGQTLSESLGMGITQGQGYATGASRNLAYSTINNYNLAVRTGADAREVIQNFEIMKGLTG